MLQRRVDLQESARAAIGAGGPREYQGLAGYTDFIPKDAAEARSMAKVTGTAGPLRAPTNVRGICRIDYQPDICKDYKETGYCGFGDSCKFLHDRGDYKSGWQIDKEWDAEQLRKRKALESRVHRGGGNGAEDSGVAGAAADGDNPFLITEDDEAEGDGEGEGDSGGAAGAGRAVAVDEDSLPFACHICRGAFVRPVVTQCGHHFCEPCAVARFATTGSCAVCGGATQGIFNASRKLEARLLRRAAAVASGSGSAAAASSSAAGGDSGVDGGGWGDVVEAEAAPATAAGTVEPATAAGTVEPATLQALAPV